MKAHFVIRCTIISFLIVTVGFIHVQAKDFDIYPYPNQKEKSGNNQLNFQSTDKKIEHVFQITLKKKDFRRLSEIDSLDKDYISEFIMVYNEDTLDARELELRGKSSMDFVRKSFSIKLNEKVTFKNAEAKCKLKKFNLISLSMDKNFYRNKVAFDLMSELGIFNLFYDYAEVFVNGKTQGVYLLLQKPKNYAFKKEDSDMMLRRNYENIIKKTYMKGDDSVKQVKLKEAFLSIYNNTLRKDGQLLYDELSEVLDIHQYYSWMAFNFLIGNRDYTDEVFFFNTGNGDSLKFRIIPWDYDDIFYEVPHEGKYIRDFSFGNKLAFSSEDALDYKLVCDDYTYSKYLEVLKQVTEELTESVIRKVFETSYQELYPFFIRKDILKAAKGDRFGKTSLNNLETDMQEIYSWIIERRKETIKKLDRD